MSSHERKCGNKTLVLASWLDAATLWYSSGLIVALGASFGFSLLGPGSAARSTRGDLIDSLAIHDARWYKQIATEGYSYDPNKRSNVAFFPVHPLLGRFIAAALPVRCETALLIAANASFLFALVVLGLYARARCPTADASTAGYAVLSACMFPTACFFRLPYSESSFLLLALVAMYAIERRWPFWLTAAIVGLGTAVRPVGVALLAPLMIDIWRRGAPLTQRLTRIALGLPIGCWGLAAFVAFQYAAFGEPLAFAKTQRYWGMRLAPDVLDRIVALATFEPIRAVYDQSSPVFWAGLDSGESRCFSLQFANPLFFMAAIALVSLGAWRRWLTPGEITLSALLLLIPYVTRSYEMGMGSMGRFVAVAFPIYLVLGRLLSALPPPIAAGLVAISGVMMACYSALYAAGHLIF